MDSFDWNRLLAACVFSASVFASAWGIGYLLIKDTTPIKSALFLDNDDKKINLASANISKGKQIAANQCGLCHSFNKDDSHKIGPYLYDIMDRHIASVQGFNYSQSLKKHRKEQWDIQNLNQWLIRPSAFASDTNMAYPGMPSKQDRIDLIAYLKTLSSNHQDKEILSIQYDPAKSPDIQRVTNLSEKSKTTQISEKNIVTGKQNFEHFCAVCHSVKPNGTHGLGPNLYDIVDKPIASKGNYTYSKALKAKQGDWTESSLDQWLENPEKWAPGNKMIYNGIASLAVRKEIILYLRSLSPQENH
ncbi:c-type cytochrome [Commensalibacter oyaizuii]|uniref:C-type cytochrome n=1 Tax=Commensalibacter oyaizuii TaxID=3043873 RepID=A0ABT6PZI4_9PROT|nr:c-type cytochrome [Commensalibacter sp. TBRC 16381]MDI2090268.1 c-type cytochrome [Commensalibacter sp. TBRC 16381]